MKKLGAILSITALICAVSLPAYASSNGFNPKGTFVDQYGTSFTFSLCGTGTDLCGMLDVLKGNAATKDNLAYVGKQVMEAKASGANTWKGALSAGGMSAQATVTQTSPNTITIQGCRAIVLCQTLTYTRT
jgi:hypothetical protein